MSKDINSIRQGFLDFFQKKNHRIISSSSLIPDKDLTLLFTNSGMNQFKNIFLGVEIPLFKRVVTAQRCVRAGGKHNDLENVGYNGRHLTFFEMLGNFSFDDYFKIDAIQFAWELLTDSKWFNLSKDKFWITVHVCDDESYNIWTKIVGVPFDRVVRIGNVSDDITISENFWQMGDVGPCGLCSEIFYDLGSHLCGYPPGSSKTCGSRYIEIWNLVFIQFNRKINGDLLSLPTVSVDTGMGLERISSIMQNVCDNYSIDLFKHLISSIHQILEIPINITFQNEALRVIADHIRSCVFLIFDGVFPSNEGRGYVLRRIIRRAIRHGRKLGKNSVFFYKLVIPCIEAMKNISSSLEEKKSEIQSILLNEEKLFLHTLHKGFEILKKELIFLQGDVLDGKKVFDLYSTYGMPLDVIKDICYEKKIQVDDIGFNRCMLMHKDQAKKSNSIFIKKNNIFLSNFSKISSIFVGYDCLRYQSKIIALLKNNELVNEISLGEEGKVILNKTPFYGESGGQVGDQGFLKDDNNNVFRVKNTYKYGKVIVHVGMMDHGAFKVGEKIIAQVDEYVRYKICLNHSATHLLHASLLEVLGSHVVQKGSFINHKYLRFDFSHNFSMTEEQILAVENLVNKKIWKNFLIQAEMMLFKTVQNKKIKMLSNKLYSDVVRVLSIGNFSFELCGGTHAKKTGDIGVFCILKEFSVSSGIRRIEAVTEERALSIMLKKKELLQNIMKLMHSDEKTLIEKLYKLKTAAKRLEKKVYQLENKKVMETVSFSKREVYSIKNVKVLIKFFDYEIENKILRDKIDYFKYLLKSGILIFFINVQRNNEKYRLVVSITQDLTNCISAFNLMRFLEKKSSEDKKTEKSDFAQTIIYRALKISDILDEINKFLKKYYRFA